jgi:hypothetical protein
VGHIPPSRPCLQHYRPSPSQQAGHAIFLPGSLPSRPQCLADPTRQHLSFTGGNRYAPDPLRRLVPSQTHPLPLLRLHATRRCNPSRPVTLEPCPSAFPLRGRRCAIWPHRAPRCPIAPLRACAAATPKLLPCHQSTTTKPGAEGSPTNQGRDRALMRLLGYPPCRAKLHGSKHRAVFPVALLALWPASTFKPSPSCLHPHVAT